MSEDDDRAAKAARAKALLKKRQQKKAGGSGTLASPPPSRSFTPALAETPAPPEEAKNDISDIFSPTESDANWIESLPRAEVQQPRASPPVVMPKPSTPVKSPPPTFQSPPAVASPSPILASVPNGRASGELRELVNSQKETITSLQNEIQTAARGSEELLRAERSRSNDLESKLEILNQSLQDANNRFEELHVELQKGWQEQDQNQQQTIALLVSEKTSLTASVSRLEELESVVAEKDALLQEERDKTQTLDKRVQSIEANLSKVTHELQESVAKEKDLGDRYRDQEREHQLALATVEELRGTADQHQRRARELEEQIQSDDRAERLEESLKNTQDRADELEFQLSKLKQTHAAIKTEKDEIESQLRSHRAEGSELKTKHVALEEQHSSLQHHFEIISGDKDALFEEKSALQSQVEFNQSAVRQLQQKLGEVASELSSSDRALQNAQNELRIATRRAEDAERIQKDLQAEGTTLMRSLDEMRPKIVELTASKLELVEKIGKLEHDQKNRDAVISKLENEVIEATTHADELRELQEDATSVREKDTISFQRTIAELQRGYMDLEKELEASQGAVRSLDTERTRLRQTEIKQLEAIARLTGDAQRQEEDIASLESQVRSYRTSHEEQHGFIDRSNDELESLRAELVSREAEIEELREMVSSAATSQGPRSLDDEMLSSLRQQHAIELSSASSQIRALETSVFEAQATSHKLQKQISILEDQLAQTRSASRATSRPFSPGIPRPSSRAQSQTDVRRGSFGHKPSNLAPLSRSVFDVGLSPETRHKRQVSLSMLKARIDSEAAAAGSHSSSRALSPIPQGSRAATPSIRDDIRSLHSDHLGKRPQFMDESHIFWCHSCQGDLVIL
ncbi:hypothetical protein BJ138DRAFT_997362 [Hygrophoropsis aurantiaca]|uniref:Uncharacterized protein n=1 Tax=Hygrophoropsis aurantiaca TaxID=72124 RepID=A0ACB8ARC2_9AGAM|nr:hypothetical protein BJ138DRAFT_997362 [Hygrophoropsis aurantiaca]